MYGLHVHFHMYVRQSRAWRFSRAGYFMKTQHIADTVVLVPSVLHGGRGVWLWVQGGQGRVSCRNGT